VGESIVSGTEEKAKEEVESERKMKRREQQ